MDIEHSSFSITAMDTHVAVNLDYNIVLEENLGRSFPPGLDEIRSSFSLKDMSHLSTTNVNSSEHFSFQLQEVSNLLLPLLRRVE